MRHSEKIRRDLGQCSTCGSKLDGHTDMQPTPRPPEPGDLSVCIYCAEALIVTPDMKVRPVQMHELQQIKEESPEIYELFCKARMGVLLSLPREMP
jgi:hypothetical protein